MIDEQILSVLRTSADYYVSGEELCKLSDISRAAIWKHIENLRAEGYEIEASPHLGYRLIAVPDSLIPAEIKWNIKTKVLGKEVISFKKVDSTNAVAYGLAEKGVKEGAVVLAEEQAKGKGRHGRRWISPSKGGIYMSCVLRPEIAPGEIAKITLAAAVAVAKAIRLSSGLSAMIKWPNDILVNNRKVCGILTEMKAEQDSVDFIILGIGVNVNTQSRYLPKGASSLREEMRRMGWDEALSRIEISRKILEKLEEYYFLLKKDGFKPIIEEWKAFSAMLGSRVRIMLPGRSFEGHAHDVDSDGSLLVRRDEGIIEKVSSGDVVVVR
ncbi:MAG: biotin--[acetyl-CoA-carboxylase] ligase [Candidatus Omnitrophota bacterium]|nr:biotin--[acetyl-CoA-carboxylase] ligase [Candidatus Omnitrophota bacterium]